MLCFSLKMKVITLISLVSEIKDIVMVNQTSCFKVNLTNS